MGEFHLRRWVSARGPALESGSIQWKLKESQPAINSTNAFCNWSVVWVNYFNNFQIPKKRHFDGRIQPQPQSHPLQLQARQRQQNLDAFLFSMLYLKAVEMSI